MRWLLRAIIFAICLLLQACAPIVLPDRSTHYSYTFGDLEDRIILENLARFIDDEDRIPSLVDFKQGSVQATDNLALGATIPVSTGLSGTNIVKNPTVFNVGSAQTQSQDNWTYVPVTDVEDLGRVRCLYKFVIEQTRQAGLSWAKFSRSCKIGGQSLVFSYSPPPQPWLIWFPADDPGAPQGDYITSPAGIKLKFLGVHRSHALWGRLDAFHDFELAVLGAIPNTAGASGTSKVAAAAGVALSILSDDPTPKFTGPNQTLKFVYRIKNTGNDTINQIAISSSATTLGDCTSSFSLLPGEQRNCDATRLTNDADVRNCIRDLTTAVGQGKGSGLISAAVRKELCANARPITINQEVSKPSILPFFIPGKSSGSIVPPPAAPAQ
jgi:hypothetical protein